MNSLKNFINSNREGIGVIVIILIITTYCFYIQNERAESGVITIARVERFEGSEQGVDLYITIFFEDKKYSASVDVFCKGCEGKFFFVKILKNSPNKYVEFYKSNLVPECILKLPLPSEGWKEIPKCK